jgi:hypothetical protein
MSLFDLLEKFSRQEYPNLEAAANAVPLDHLVTPGQPVAKLAQTEQTKLEEEALGDFCQFQLSLGEATKSGGAGQCEEKDYYDAADQRLGNWAAQNTSQNERVPFKPFPAGRRLPPRTPSAPGGLTPVSLASVRVNRGQNRQPRDFVVPTLSPRPSKARQNQQAERFIQAQAGGRGAAIGDSALVVGGTGTPYPGTAYQDRANLLNSSANLATSTPPVVAAPARIRSSPIGTGAVNRTEGRVAPKSNTAGNVLALLGIAAAVSAIMFALQYVISTIQFVFSIQQLLTTCNNLAASFGALFNTIGSLLGLGEDVAKPLTSTVDGLLNSVFGKEKVDYVKYQWAKVSSVMSSAASTIGNIRSASAALASGVETTGNNTGKIGNALKAAGLIDNTIGTFEEKISARPGKVGDLTSAIEKAGTVSASLSSAASDVKSGQEELARLDQEEADRLKEGEKGKTEAEKRDAPDAVEIPKLSPGDM